MYIVVVKNLGNVAIGYIFFNPATLFKFFFFICSNPKLVEFTIILWFYLSKSLAIKGVYELVLLLNPSLDP